MRTTLVVGLLLVELVAVAGFSAVKDQGLTSAPQAEPLLDQKVKRFEVVDESLVGIAKLSQLPIGLHFGVEEILGDTLRDPIARNVRFTVDLLDKTIREILDALCQSDLRYRWSAGRATINVDPRSIVGDASYLLNRQIKRIALEGVPDPEQALKPLDRQLLPRREQLGYSGVGGNSTYAKPWTVGFEDIAVRQFINRIAEHMGPRTSWFWKGTKKERFFTFIKGGVRTETVADGPR